jgi:hypothetical protein
MRCRLAFYFPLFAALLLSLSCTDRADAIPAFSRLHKTECTTCHTIYPELNEYGEAFLKNSFVYMGKPADRKKGEGASPGGGDKGEGSDSTKDMKNEGLWLAAIPEILPVSLTASLDIAYDNNPPNGDKLDLTTRSLVLQAGGAFRDKAGFFLNYNLYSQGRYDPLSGNVPGNNTPDIRELFLIWRHALNTPINLKFGRLEPKLSLWKRSNKITVSSLATTAYKVGRSPFSVDATEDALEANAVLGSRLFVAGGVVDRNGQNTKEGYGHLSYKFGGADYLGNEPEIDLDKESIWDYLSVVVGAYGYGGRNASLIGSLSDEINSYYRAGVDIDLVYKKLRMRLSGVKGKDTNPDFLAQAVEINSVVLASEAEYLFDTNLIGVFRYEYQDDGAAITRRYIPAVAYAPLQNTKFTLEYKYEGVASYRTAGSINRIALLGAVFSF